MAEQTDGAACELLRSTQAAGGFLARAPHRVRSARIKEAPAARARRGPSGARMLAGHAHPSHLAYARFLRSADRVRPARPRLSVREQRAGPLQERRGGGASFFLSPPDSHPIMSGPGGGAAVVGRFSADGATSCAITPPARGQAVAKLAPSCRDYSTRAPQPARATQTDTAGLSDSGYICFGHTGDALTEIYSHYCSLAHYLWLPAHKAERYLICPRWPAEDSAYLHSAVLEAQRKQQVKCRRPDSRLWRKPNYDHQGSCSRPSRR